MRVEGHVAFPEGNLTLTEATRALVEGEGAVDAGVEVFDLDAVGQVDSSALSLLLSWRRRANGRNRPLSFRNLPDNLLSLAKLYGVGDLITA